MTSVKNINGRITRGQGADHSFCDMSMINMIFKDKTQTEILRVKVLSEEFLEYTEYEIFIDREWYMRMSVNRMTKKGIPVYNKHWGKEWMDNDESGSYTRED